jgi:hypothetical protein
VEKNENHGAHRFMGRTRSRDVDRVQHSTSDRQAAAQSDFQLGNDEHELSTI